MATTYQPTTPEAAAEEPVNYLNVEYGWKSWLFTTDHKRIAMLYLWSITVMFIIGGAFAMLVRIHLTQPTGLFPPEIYNRLFTMHGVIMIFFFLVPSIPATLGNFLLPIQIGAKDLAFPRVNLLSWYLYIGGFRYLRRGPRWCGYRLDFLRTVQHHLFKLLRSFRRHRRLHRRLLLYHHRSEFYRYRA